LSASETESGCRCGHLPHAPVVVSASWRPGSELVTSSSCVSRSSSRRCCEPSGRLHLRDRHGCVSPENTVGVLDCFWPPQALFSQGPLWRMRGDRDVAQVVGEASPFPGGCRGGASCARCGRELSRLSLSLCPQQLGDEDRCGALPWGRMACPCRSAPGMHCPASA
jgi:hypothetical protein